MAGLNRRHARTLDQVFQHPLPANLRWNDVMHLFDALGAETEEHDGKVKVRLNGQNHTFARPHHKDVADRDELMQLRHFLDAAGVDTKAGGDQSGGGHFVVHLTHQRTDVYRATMRGTVPEHLEPYDPRGHVRHLHDVRGRAQGRGPIADPQYYERIAETLAGADEILVVGHATGESSAADEFVSRLRRHHPETAGQVVGTVVAGDLTPAQLLAAAHGYWAHAAP
ncbi:MAG: hypothetical protein ACRDWD_03275 [Acidimicrobiia bacterium]